MIPTLLGLSSTNWSGKSRRFGFKGGAVEPTRGVGLIEVRGDLETSGYVTTGGVVASQNAEGWFSTGAPPPLDRRNTAGGVASGVSRFVVSGGPPPIGADGTHGQCESSVGPRPRGGRCRP